MAPILCIAAVCMEAEATLKVSRHIDWEMALILCIVAVETEETPESSRNIVLEMALILCMMALGMVAAANLNFSRHIVR